MARSKLSFVPPGLTITVTSGRSICAIVWNRSLFVHSAMGVLPAVITGAENQAVRSRGRVMVMPPIATSNLLPCRSAISFGQAVGTISSFTPIVPAKACAMSTSMPLNVPVWGSRYENGL